MRDWYFVRAVYCDNMSAGAFKDVKLRPAVVLSEHVAESLFVRVAMKTAMAAMTPLDEFLKLYWSGAVDLAAGTEGTKWKRHDAPRDAWFSTDFVDPVSKVSRRLDMDTIGGTFLVDGSPCKRLPKEITNSVVYERLFSQALFTVQPVGCGFYKTATKIAGAHFLFRLSPRTKKPVIVEERMGEDGHLRRSVLVSHSAFMSDLEVGGWGQNPNELYNDDYSDDFPVKLIQEHSHWLRWGGAHEGGGEDEDVPMAELEEEEIPPPEENLEEKLRQLTEERDKAVKGYFNAANDWDTREAFRKQWAALHIDEIPALMKKKIADKKSSASTQTTKPPEPLKPIPGSWSLDFRPVLYSDAEFGSRTDYALDYGARHLLDARENLKLLDVNSATVKKLQQSVFRRLSPRQHLHCFYCSGKVLDKDAEAVAVVQLVRLQKLRFVVRNAGKIGAVENAAAKALALPSGGAAASSSARVLGAEHFGLFGGTSGTLEADHVEGLHAQHSTIYCPELQNFRVAADQNCGTLSGLQQALLLEPAPVEQRSSHDVEVDVEDKRLRHRQQQGRGKQQQKNENPFLLDEDQEDERLDQYAAGKMELEDVDDGMENHLDGKEPKNAAPTQHKRTAPDEDRVLLVPHGPIVKLSANHTAIDTRATQQPSFFKYELREALQDLLPQKERSSSLFLALLHAATSGLLKDEFLGCSGVQRAIAILKSGRCRGSSVVSMNEADDLDKIRAEMTILQQIAELAPTRAAALGGVFERNSLGVLTVDPLGAANPWLPFLARDLVEQTKQALVLAGRKKNVVEEAGGGVEEILGAASKNNSLAREFALFSDAVKNRCCGLAVRAMFLFRENYSDALRPSEKELGKICGSDLNRKQNCKLQLYSANFFSGKVCAAQRGGKFTMMEGSGEAAKKVVAKHEHNALEAFCEIVKKPTLLKSRDCGDLYEQLCSEGVNKKHSSVGGRNQTIPGHVSDQDDPAGWSVGSDGQMKQQDLLGLVKGWIAPEMPEDAEERAELDRSRCMFVYLLIDLYQMARFAARSASLAQKQQFRIVLAALALEYPEEIGTLRGLLGIAMSGVGNYPGAVNPLGAIWQTAFPEPPVHNEYVRPYRHEFQTHVLYNRVVEYVRVFPEAEPVQQQGQLNWQGQLVGGEDAVVYQQRRSQWLARRNQHNAKNTRLCDGISAEAERVFRTGADCIFANLESELTTRGLNLRNDLTSPQALVDDINRNFRDWRNSLELKTFLKEVRARFVNLQPSGMFGLAPFVPDPLEALAAPDHPSTKKPLTILERGFNDTALQGIFENEVDEHEDVGGPTISGLLEALGSRQSHAKRVKRDRTESLSQLSNEGEDQLALPNFVGKHDQQYAELAGILDSELQESWRLAEGGAGARRAAYAGPRHEEDQTLPFSVLQSAECARYLEKEMAETHKDLCTDWQTLQSVVLARPELDEVESATRVTRAELLREMLGKSLFGLSTDPQKQHDEREVGGQPEEDYCDHQPQQRRVARYFGRSIRSFQRARRCLALFRARKLFQLEAELLSTGSMGWTSDEFPSWLAFEVENNLCIRETQAQVAKELVHGSTNRLLQLNMGEGKTAVIVPIVVAAAANGKDLVRATVLSSLFATNAADLQFKLGGLLDRRIVPMLFRRDLRFDAADTAELLQFFQLAKESGDIVLTVPECRLSLENKALELAAKGSDYFDLVACAELQKLAQFFNENTREILDESDEILRYSFSMHTTSVGFNAHHVCAGGYRVGTPRLCRWAHHVCGF